MDSSTIIIIIVVVVSTVVCALTSKIIKNKMMKRLLEDLKKADFEDYFKMIDSTVCKFYFPAFNREYMRMNGLVMQGEKEKVEEQFDLMLNMRMNKQQEIDIVMKCFYYYLEDENKRKAKTLLERIRKFGEDYFKESQVMYDVCLEKSVAYIDEMEEALKDPECTGPNRGMFLYMLGLQYGNGDQKKKMKEYLREAQGLLKNTPYELKIRSILK
ncbi:hypothetical protein [Amedibacillus sp. YH-ame10]